MLYSIMRTSEGTFVLRARHAKPEYNYMVLDPDRPESYIPGISYSKSLLQLRNVMTLIDSSSLTPVTGLLAKIGVRQSAELAGIDYNPEMTLSTEIDSSRYGVDQVKLYFNSLNRVLKIIIDIDPFIEQTIHLEGAGLLPRVAKLLSESDRYWLAPFFRPIFLGVLRDVESGSFGGQVPLVLRRLVEFSHVSADSIDGLNPTIGLNEANFKVLFKPLLIACMKAGDDAQLLFTIVMKFLAMGFVPNSSIEGVHKYILSQYKEFDALKPLLEDTNINIRRIFWTL